MRAVNNTGLSNKAAGILFFTIMTLCIGVLLPVLGFVFANLHMANWPTVPGVIVSHVGTGTPIFEYVVAGQTFQYQSDVTRNPPLPIGTVRELRVNPENPHHAGVYRPAFMLMGLGLPLGVGVGWAGYRAFSKKPDYPFPPYHPGYPMPDGYRMPDGYPVANDFPMSDAYPMPSGYPSGNENRDNEQDERIRRLEEELQTLKNERNVQNANGSSDSEPKSKDEWWRS